MPEPPENNGGQQDQHLLEAPTISLPKGGGAINGIGEKFGANPVTGTGSMSVPIATSPGRSGFGPQLSLSYDSGSGNGPFGFGWSLNLPKITRKTAKGLPRYQDADESDVFILSGSEDLVPVLNLDGTRFVDDSSVPDFTIHRYRPRIEGLFARIERWTRQSDGDVHWRSISRDNILTIYGSADNSRIADPEDTGRIFSWLICETRDDKGNAVLYEYKPEDGAGVDLSQVHERNRGNQNDPRRTANRYLKRIRYGNRQPLLDSTGERPRLLTDPQIDTVDWMFEAVFDYGEHDGVAPKPNDPGQWDFRNDPFSSYRSGFEVRTTRLCQCVLMFHHIPDISSSEKGYDGLVRSTDFTYSHEENPNDVRNPIYSFLNAVTQSGYRRDGVGGYLKRSLPPVEFEYSEPVVQETVDEVDAASLENLPTGLNGSAYQWTDLHGEGIPGILTEQGGGWFYKRNLSPIGKQPVEFAPLERIATKPNSALAGGAQFMDLAGDGQLDVVMLDGPMPGFYEHDAEEGWDSFRPLTSRLNRDMRDPNLKFVDLDGDGHADVLISEDDAFVWHASLAEEGFGPARRVAQVLDEEEGPRLVFMDGTQSIYLADLSGDGLTDLVRIRNGEICYWPNLGYCRFGARVTMSRAPHFDHPDQFDHKRIRLADIDGSGATDIIYLHRDGVRLYFNQSGNSWSEPQVLCVFPRVDDLVNIMPTDLLGNGTACLVWSSPLPGDAVQPMRYVNLMGGQKPHLLVKTINNLGAETRVHYAPSTKFYLQDKRDGKPWISKLAFPVHVVERVETFDHISNNRFTIRYAYHHGYFDGAEREFRGFGMVEQWDTEEFAALTADGTLPAAANVNAASHVPPIHTKTWFHTGIYLGRDHVSDFFAGLLNATDQGEYFREPGLTDAQARALLLPDTVLPPGLTLEEEIEACRALKGSMLRQEVYAEDGYAKAEFPYTVTEQNFTIQSIQGRGDNRHGVFLAHPREAISYHYERNPADPRIQHALTLEVDEFGNVLKEAAVGYGRRLPDVSLSAQDQARQTQVLATYTENQVTNSVDVLNDYRTPLPAETRTYELTGYTPTGGAGRFRSADFVTDAGNVLSHIFDNEINYEDQPSSNRQRRLIEHVRIFYRKNDLTAFLPLGEIESMALPGESYKLAFTPGLLNQVFQRDGQPLLPTPVSVLDGNGGYVDLDGDSHWWIPSGRSFFVSVANVVDLASTAVAGLITARAHFFLPRKITDPFGNSTLVDYDVHDLLTTSTSDALGNTVVAENDYRVLQPWRITDPNGNRSEAVFDVLGMVVATAVMGKNTETLGDLPTGFDPDISLADLQGFVADPQAQAPSLLGNATTRIVYDLDRYQLVGLPSFAATLARETHVSDLQSGQVSKIQISFSYSDGFGREIQKKVQAEPGPVPKRDGGGRIIVGSDGQPEMTADSVDPRWVGSGWTIFNNKGKPVRQYEPFFSDTHKLDFDTRIGVSPILFYDPVERVIATLHPNHTYEKVVFDPWIQTTFDVNDTVAASGAQTGDPRTDPDIAGYVDEYFKTQPAAWETWFTRMSDSTDANERNAALRAELHTNTPSTAHFDSLGRPFLTIADNGSQGKYETRTVLDIEGNQREVIDAKQRVVISYSYHMAGPEQDENGEQKATNRIHQESMDAGQRWMLVNVLGNPLRKWDERGHEFRYSYDELNRLVESKVLGGDGDTPLGHIIERIEYGEDETDAVAKNLRGQICRHYDTGGLLEMPEYDFKGNPKSTTRRLFANYKEVPNWTGLATGLESEAFTFVTEFDALGRIVKQIAPDGSEITPSYNEAGLLDGETVKHIDPDVTTTYINNIDYNEKGQRERIVYGNGVVTRFDYDSETFRLIRLKTTKADSSTLQDWRYTYDPVGNITRIEDSVAPTVFFNNSMVKAVSEYIYDALYRLIEATGRENNAALSFGGNDNWNDAAFMQQVNPGDAMAMRNYKQTYQYDEVGNILQMQHITGTSGSWMRNYAYDKANNRLINTTVGTTTTYNYPHHALHGYMTAMPHLDEMGWNFNEELVRTIRQRRTDGGTPETTYYQYDGQGQRIRKITENSARPGITLTKKEERIYIAGYELYKKNSGTNARLERRSLSLMDEEHRFVMVETQNGVDPDTELHLVRYQLHNHLGSAALELNAAADVISYEEYHPYGTTAYQARNATIKAAAKRYRYTGKERDEETGLACHGVRYYVPWLCRWVSADPIGIFDGVNLYNYSRNTPINLIDNEGKQGTLPHNYMFGTSSDTSFFTPLPIETHSPDKLGVTTTNPRFQLIAPKFFYPEHSYPTPQSITTLKPYQYRNKELSKAYEDQYRLAEHQKALQDVHPVSFGSPGSGLGLVPSLVEGMKQAPLIAIEEILIARTIATLSKQVMTYSQFSKATVGSFKSIEGVHHATYRGAAYQLLKKDMNGFINNSIRTVSDVKDWSITFYDIYKNCDTDSADANIGINPLGEDSIIKPKQRKAKPTF